MVKIIKISLDLEIPEMTLNFILSPYIIYPALFYDILSFSDFLLYLIFFWLFHFFVSFFICSFFFLTMKVQIRIGGCKWGVYNCLSLLGNITWCLTTNKDMAMLARHLYLWRDAIRTNILWTYVWIQTYDLKMTMWYIDAWCTINTWNMQ